MQRKFMGVPSTFGRHCRYHSDEVYSKTSDYFAAFIDSTCQMKILVSILFGIFSQNFVLFLLGPFCHRG